MNLRIRWNLFVDELVYRIDMINHKVLGDRFSDAICIWNSKRTDRARQELVKQGWLGDV